MLSEIKKSVKLVRRSCGGFIRRSVCLPACGGAEICENPCYLSAVALAKAESVVNFEYNKLWHKSLKQNQPLATGVF
jgi:hypothetical protein